jgi:ParB family chromosome partitioning protein
MSAKTQTKSKAKKAAVAVAAEAEAAAPAASGAAVLIPLDKLKKSPRNARRTPHAQAAIEALAASIHVKGMLQNLVVEPERDGQGQETGFYFVTAGEGRRLAQLLRVKRKQIKKCEPIRCLVERAADAHELSLDENVTRSDLHPADQFEAFRRLSEEKGWGAEEIAARFGVTAHVVRQRLKLAAVSPKLMQFYREVELTLEQLMAFAVSDDHARQEQVWAKLSWNKEPSVIRRAMTEAHVRANDRRAVLVGVEAYEAAGGAVVRDLFSEDGGGWFADAGLLDRLALEKLQAVAADVREAEGWRWAEAAPDFPHAHGLGRFYPRPGALKGKARKRLAAARAELEALELRYDGVEELPEDADEAFAALEGEIERLEAADWSYGPELVAQGGVFVVLGHDGAPRIERGFVRPEDGAEGEAPEADAEEDIGEERNESAESERDDTPTDDDENADADEIRPLSDALIRDLTAWRTLGLRLALGSQPDVALTAVVHALAAETFRVGRGEASCLDLQAVSTPLGGHAAGIDDSAAAQALAERHDAWAARMPRDADALWSFVAMLPPDERLALLAHCVGLTAFAVRQPWERRPGALRGADRLAAALSLDMTAVWRPTVASYLGRMPKARVVEAVREGVSAEAAERIAGLKKQAMAEAAETLLAGTGWLPEALRTPEAEASDTEAFAA